MSEIEKLEDLSDPCEIISSILCKASIDEAYVFKPGNASRDQDIESVRFKDIIESALLLKTTYYTSCKRGINNSRPIFDLLYNTVIISLRIGIRFSLFGTSILLLPIAYLSANASSIWNLLELLKKNFNSLDEVEGEWFIKTLRLLNPSYLGKLEGKMDYRNMSKVKLSEILEYSARVDSVSRNVVLGYPFSLKVYKILKEGRCGSFESDVQRAYISLLKEIPDGLIYRKHGARAAINVAKYARNISECPSEAELKEFNKYLLSNKFNPGSTADLVASGIALFYLERYFYLK
ncbi:MAG: triphosphoribosyl-dephospho-CoA synthase [Sulfolobaceae archaeon]